MLVNLLGNRFLFLTGLNLKENNLSPKPVSVKVSNMDAPYTGYHCVPLHPPPPFDGYKKKEKWILPPFV